MPSRLILATCSLAERWRTGNDPDNYQYPVGLASLHAVAERAGHAVETLYLVAEEEGACVARILAAIKAYDAQVLGLSVITDNRVATCRAIEGVHAQFPHVRIVLGGVHVSTQYGQLLARYPYAVAVLGEGELTLVDLLDAFESGRDLAEVQGIAYWCDGAVATTEPRPMIADLDWLPIPRHDLFYSPRRVLAQIMTSRGCPYACSFCCLDSVSRRKVRAFSVNRVIDEIEMIVTRWPQTTTIHICDDQFFADNNRVIAFCDEIVRRKIKVAFWCQGRVRPLGRELVLALERAGVTSVTLGLESGSQEIIDRCRKKIRLSDVERAMRLFADSLIGVRVLLIIGLPGETLATITETIEFCRRLQKIKYHEYSTQISDLFVYPGTEVYEISKAAGAIDDSYWLGEGDCPRFEVENDADTYGIMRRMLLDGLALNRILTADGFAAQRDMLGDIVRYVFLWEAWFPKLAALVVEATEQAIRAGRATFEVVTAGPIGQLSLLTAQRKPGNENAVQLGYHGLPQGLRLEDLIRMGFIHGMPAVTAVVERAVADYLGAAFAAPDGRLERFK